MLSLAKSPLYPLENGIIVDDDASPEVLETMEAAANIHVDDTITPRVGLSSDTPPQLEQWSSCIS